MAAPSVDGYTLLKFFHILFAITAVGSNLTYGFWIGTSTRTPEMLPHILRRIRMLDNYVANPAYGLVLVSGLGLVGMGGWGFTTGWVVMALALWLIVALVGVFLYSPALKAQIHALDRYGFHADTYHKAATRATFTGITTMVLVVATLVLMVFRPMI